jgi:phosphoserine aminotransferase
MRRYAMAKVSHKDKEFKDKANNLIWKLIDLISQDKDLRIEIYYCNDNEDFECCVYEIIQVKIY